MYTISILIYVITGPTVARPPAIESNEDTEMDFDDHRDYLDQDPLDGELPTAESGPIAQFLSDVPDWLNMTPEDLNKALETLPIPLEGQPPPGLSIHEAIEVNQSPYIHRNDAKA